MEPERPAAAATKPTPPAAAKRFNAARDNFGAPAASASPAPVSAPDDKLKAMLAELDAEYEVAAAALKEDFARRRDELIRSHAAAATSSPIELA